MENTVITITSNRKAHFNYKIEEKYICGMRISGSEIKSIRNNKCSIQESFCYIKDGEMFIKNMYIKHYEYSGKYNNHEEIYDRKLLLTKQEINKIFKKVSEKGYSIIPLRVLLKNGWAKIEIGIGKGKKTYDKRNDLKEKDLKREINKY